MWRTESVGSSAYGFFPLVSMTAHCRVSCSGVQALALLAERNLEGSDPHAGLRSRGAAADLGVAREEAAEASILGAPIGSARLLLIDRRGRARRLWSFLCGRSSLRWTDGLPGPYRIRPLHDLVTGGGLVMRRKTGGSFGVLVHSRRDPLELRPVSMVHDRADGAREVLGHSAVGLLGLLERRDLGPHYSISSNLSPRPARIPARKLALAFSIRSRKRGSFSSR